MIFVKCKLVSLNVRGINNFRKRRTIYSWCRKQKADFIFLQETHSKHETERQWKNEWGGEIIMSHGSPIHALLPFFFRKELIASFIQTFETQEDAEASEIGLSIKSELMQSSTRNEKRWKEKKKR